MQRIICGDNLKVLKKIPSESVDLCYIDPPFFSGRKYAVIFGDDEEVRQFDDRWIKMAEKGKYSKDINVYLNWMEPRIKEIHRVLKKTGSFYLHCDWHADSYLRIICDGIFNNNLINHIIWKRQTPSKPSKIRYSNCTDSILFYSKSKNYNFKEQYSKKIDLAKFKQLENDTNRYFTTSPVENKPNFKFKGEERIFYDSHGKKILKSTDQGWKWSQSTIDKRWNDNNHIFYFTSSGKVRYKRYADEFKGNKVSNIWDDITMIGSSSKERLGYPTQKPEALLERIIKASSNEGDVVLDAFCGCGTTLAVANKLKRDFIGIDVSPTACRVMADRLDWTHNMIEGMPLNTKEVEALSGWEFQNWINREFGAVNGKKGADGGIDGDYNGVPIQVKKYRAGRPDLDNFSGVLLREGKKEGIYIAISYTSTFIKEVNRLDRDNGVTIHYFTPDDIMAKKHEPILYEIDNV